MRTGAVFGLLIALAHVNGGPALAAPSRVAGDVPEIGNIAGIWWAPGPPLRLSPVDGRDIPFTAQGRRAYAANQARMGGGLLPGGKATPRDRVAKYCLPEGVTRAMTSGYPFQIATQGDLVVIAFEKHRSFRQILFHEAHPGEDLLDPSMMGDSIAHWEGDTLVVDTVGLKTHSTLDATGLPYGERLHVVERLRTLQSGRQLEDLMTIDDADMYVRPWTVRVTYQSHPETHIQEWICGQPHRDPESSAVAVQGSFVQTAGQEGLPASTATHAVAIPEFSGVFRYRPSFDPRKDDIRQGREFGNGDKPSTFDGWTNRDAMLQPWSRAEMQRRDAAINAGEPLLTNSTNCVTDGFPAIVDIPKPFRIVQLPNEILFLYIADYQQRHVRLGGPHNTNPKPQWFGDSVARYEGDTLVIDTLGLSSRTHLNWDGMPHTDALHVIERYRMSGTDLLELTLTLEDPGALTGVWTFNKTFARLPPTDPESRRMTEYVCAENNHEPGITLPAEF